MQTYIVRIYRRNSEKPDWVVGVVEEVETENTWKFSALSELRSIFRGEEDKGNAKELNEP
ncbi:hypothetical protein [Desulforhopalus sp. 52FAK]